MSKLFYKDKPVIGLDISQTGIKVMSIDPKKWLVLGYGSLDLDPAKVQVSMDNQEDAYLKESIATLLKENIVGSLDSDHVVVGLPTGRTFSRTFTLPASQERQLAGAVEVEVDQYIPIPLGSLYLDYEIIERTKDTLTVVMAAVPATLVDACLSAVRAVGLTPVMAEPSINAVARVIEATEEGHLSTLIVDIGPANTDIAVLDKGAIRVSGGVGIGGNTFTLDIAKKLDVALENAHQLKVLNGLSAGPKQANITAALRPSLQRITTEVRKVIRYYNERLNDDRKIEQVLVVGGGANVPGIGEYFTNELVMPARVGSPWQKLDFGALQEPNKQFRPRYIAVAGLANIPREKIWK
ncbi:pilus assembly protein PilM [Candidatus Saccharibacteria bacterium]|nr:MAG: pilus assembly protein PilM [Candidatus Saccharibacteria bacterium]